MIKHIVVWKLKDPVLPKTKFDNALMIKEKLESLNGKIEGMIKLEVGIDFSKTENSSDIILYSEFASKKDLENYMMHPEHKAVVPMILESVTERRLIDYVV